MNPNQFPWPSSPSSSHQSLEQQLANLNLLSQEFSLINHPRSSRRHFPDNNNNNNYDNHNNDDFFPHYNPFTFPYTALGPNTAPVFGPTGRDYHASNSSTSNILDNITYDEYLAMLRYTRTDSSNNVSGFRARSQIIQRNNRNNCFSGGFRVNNWKELRGKVAEHVKDQQRCETIQKMLLKLSLNNNNNNNDNNDNNEMINMIISEVKDDLSNIVVTHNGGQIFQSLLDYCNENDITQILRVAMVSQECFVDICLDNHGSRAMQNLIRRINPTNIEQKSIILSMMKNVMLRLITSMNSYYFVTELFSSLKVPASYDLISALFVEIGNHLLEIATDKFGCCALHICLEHGHRGPHRDRVLQLIVSHAVDLSQNEYGNYVVQYIISKPRERLLDDIMKILQGQFAYFCMNKYACHVVEKCIMYGTNQHLENIVEEIMEDSNFLKILLHQTGNYVVQTAIVKCNEVSYESRRLSLLFDKLTDGVIRYEYPFLRYDRLGKHVLLCAKAEKEKNRRSMLRY